MQRLSRTFHATSLASLKVLSLKRAGLLDRKKELSNIMRRNSLSKELEEIAKNNVSVPQDVSSDFYCAERQFEMDLLQEKVKITQITALFKTIKTSQDAHYLKQQYKSMQQGLAVPQKLDKTTTAEILSALESVKATDVLTEMIEYSDTFYLSPDFSHYIRLMQLWTEKEVFKVPENVSQDLFYYSKALVFTAARRKSSETEIDQLIQLIKSQSDAEYVVQTIPEILGEKIKNWPSILDKFKSVNAYNAIALVLRDPIKYQFYPDRSFLDNEFSKTTDFHLMNTLFCAYLRNGFLPSVQIFEKLIAAGLKLGTVESLERSQRLVNECKTLGIKINQI